MMTKLEELFDSVIVWAQEAKALYDVGAEAECFARLDEVAKAVSVLREFNHRCAELRASSRVGVYQEAPSESRKSARKGKRKADEVDDQPPPPPQPQHPPPAALQLHPQHQALHEHQEQHADHADFTPSASTAVLSAPVTSLSSSSSADAHASSSTPLLSPLGSLVPPKKKGKGSLTLASLDGLGLSDALQEEGGSHDLAVDADKDLRLKLDALFLAFLERVCNDENCTDQNGHEIHFKFSGRFKNSKSYKELLYQPYRFRIQALTFSFIEEVRRSGLVSEDARLQREVREYLWCNRFLRRFTDDNKKLKVKGIMVWMVEAAKTLPGRFLFREYTRRFVTEAPSVAYVGHEYVYAPRVWDPEIEDPQVVFSAPQLPPWLGLVGNSVVCGTPDEGCEDCEVKLVATIFPPGKGKRMRENSKTLEQVVKIHVAPYAELLGGGLVGEHEHEHQGEDGEEDGDLLGQDEDLGPGPHGHDDGEADLEPDDTLSFHPKDGL